MKVMTVFLSPARGGVGKFLSRDAAFTLILSELAVALLEAPFFRAAQHEFAAVL